MREMKDSGVEWLGEVPAGWGVVPVKRVAVLKHGSDPKTAGDTPVYGSGQSAFKTCGEFKEGPSVLLGRKGTLNCPQYVEGRFWNVDTAFDVSMRSGDMALKYFFYAISSVDIGDLSTNTAKPSMTQGAWCSVKLPNPPIDEQRRIADCLDEKCVEIDRAISAAEQSIEEYKAYRLSVISAKMPTGCITIPIKYLCDLLPGYAFESGKFVQGNGVRLLRGINVGVGETRWADAAHYPEEDLDGLEAYALEPGDLVIGLDRPWIKDGLRASFITESDLPCYLVQRVVRIRMSDNLEPRYLKYGLDSGILERYVASATTGISVPHISHLQIANCKVPLPSLDEQCRIADYLDEKCVEIDRAIDAKHAIVADLKTYKKSLIYETVTGKREV